MMLSWIQRLLLYVIALTSSVGAIALLIWAGLPHHADFTGFTVDGIYVAPAIGEIAPPMHMNTLNGQHLHLDNFHGDSLIINFWATWCAPCAIEMPELQLLHEETAIQIVGINIGEHPSVIVPWVERFGLTFDIVLDPNGRIYTDYRLLGQPTTYILNPDGIITHIFHGPTNADALQRAIETHQS
ncbi:MAG: TlpA disulfide reductase family protein [Chloroflexota bacterium]